MNKPLESGDVVYEGTLDEYMKLRHNIQYDRQPARDGFTITILLWLIHKLDSFFSIPHRKFLKFILRNHFRTLSKSGRDYSTVKELNQIELISIDVWTNSWSIVHFLIIFPGVYFLSKNHSSYFQASWSGMAYAGLYTVLISLSLFRYVDIFTTLAKLHLSPFYTPHTSPRAIIGTILQFADISIAYAIIYLLLYTTLGDNAFTGTSNPFSSLLSSFYFSLSTITLNLGFSEFTPNSLLVQFIVVLEFFTGIFLLIVIFQHVVSPYKTRFTDQSIQQNQQTTITSLSSRDSFNYDRFYAAFLNRFRHEESFVKDIFRRYSETFVTKDPVVDIGCGRGEFLEILAEVGVKAYGIDSNLELVNFCRNKDLNVIHEDWKSHLEKLSSNSLGGVFCAQVIEHLSFDELVSFFSIIFQKLKPGGIVVLETLNPNVYTLFKKFYVDFTHKSPLNPDAVAFLANFIGFEIVDIQYYNNPSQDEKLEDELSKYAVGAKDTTAEKIEGNFKKLNQLIYQPHYFAIIAQKSSPIS